MGIDKKRQQLLKMLPGIDSLLETRPQAGEEIPKSVIVGSARKVIQDLRERILAGDTRIDETSLQPESIGRLLAERIEAETAPNLVTLVNATGVVVHTNLGRSLLPREALAHIGQVACSYSNLEFDIPSGKRGLRYSCVEELICEITGAEAALAVNNNAGAVLLSLETLARGSEVIVSRGELVEIGGSFRVPDVMAKSGCILREVGTTNRTHLRDYENAINENTGLLLKVHTSNYSLVGFTSDVPLSEMNALGREKGLPVMEDLGSGTFVDFGKYGLTREPTVQDSVKAGTDIVTFSGDKLLGGPQAGIIVGRKEFVDKIKKNPLTRALRIDKLTLAALESTLRLYRDEETAVQKIPTLRMLTRTREEIAPKAERLAEMLEALSDPRLSVRPMDITSRAGGGSLPLLELPSRGVGITVRGISVNALERKMRLSPTAVIGRIEEETFIMDLRTVQADELSVIRDMLATILGR